MPKRREPWVLIRDVQALAERVELAVRAERGYDNAWQDKELAERLLMDAVGGGHGAETVLRLRDVAGDLVRAYDEGRCTKRLLARRAKLIEQLLRMCYGEKWETLREGATWKLKAEPADAEPQQTARASSRKKEDKDHGEKK